MQAKDLSALQRLYSFFRVGECWGWSGKSTRGCSYFRPSGLSIYIRGPRAFEKYLPHVFTRQRFCVSWLVGAPWCVMWSAGRWGRLLAVYHTTLVCSFADQTSSVPKIKSEVIGVRKNLVAQKWLVGGGGQQWLRLGEGRIRGITLRPVADGVEDEQSAVPKYDDSYDVERSKSVPRKVGSHGRDEAILLENRRVDEP